MNIYSIYFKIKVYFPAKLIRAIVFVDFFLASWKVAQNWVFQSPDASDRKYQRADKFFRGHLEALSYHMTYIFEKYLLFHHVFSFLLSIWNTINENRIGHEFRHVLSAREIAALFSSQLNFPAAGRYLVEQIHDVPLIMYR